jgi:2-methylisocitrate lyase-like PEP mutase family enzyme
MPDTALTVDRSRLAGLAAQLRGLHRPGSPVVLANAWDAASARIVAEAGYPAVATSSHAVAECLGYQDSDSMPAAEAFGAVARIARSVDLPVTADVEAGYGLAPEAFVAQLLGAGAVGCNLEDTDHHGGGGLVDAGRNAARLAAVKEAARAAGVDIVLNARIDVRPGEDPEALAEAISRARRYLEAGADCVYPIFLADEADIERLITEAGGPVNILLRKLDAGSIARLAELGAARVSMGGGPMRLAYAALRTSVAGLREGLRA